jgi:hypothetical protein
MPLFAREPAAGESIGTTLAGYAATVCLRDDAAGTLARRPMSRSLLLALLSFSKKARLAMARHEVSRRYALPLSVLVYGRLRDLMAQGASGGADFRAANAALAEHLAGIRSQAAGAQSETLAMIDGLPLAVTDAGDLAALEKRYPGRLV